MVVSKVLELLLKWGKDQMDDAKEKRQKDQADERVIEKVRAANTKKERIDAARDLLNS